MKSEFNNYNINNPDGVSKAKLNVNKISFDNDHPRFIKEDPLAKQSELSRAKETFDERLGNKGKTVSRKKQTAPKSADDLVRTQNDPISSLTSVPDAATAAASTSAASATSAAAATTATAASATASVATTLGSGLGAVAGLAASSIATVFIIVAVFISTLSIDLSLVMADMDVLVFQVAMQNAQDQDFEQPMTAVLEGNGTYQEQEVTRDTSLLTFSGLVPNKEYVVRIKNSEKVFVEKSFITASMRISRGVVTLSKEDNSVFISVKDVVLGADGFYTVTAKDDRGNVLFVKDDDKTTAEYSFDLGEPKAVVCTLSIGGTVCSLVRREADIPLRYDYATPVWNWSDDYSATLSFAELAGRDPLIIPAEVTPLVTEPTCTEDGFTVYNASATVDDVVYSDSKKIVDEGTAFGHEFTGEPEFSWMPLYDGDASETQNADGSSTPTGYTATATFRCAHDPEHVDVVAIAPEDIGHETALPGCEEDGFIVYYAFVEYNGEEYRDEYVYALPATGHVYPAEPIFVWTETGDGFTAIAKFVCLNNEEHVRSFTATVTPEYTEPTCTEDGFVTYTAVCEENGNVYSDTKVVVDEGTATGHDYSEPEFIWTVMTAEDVAAIEAAAAGDPYALDPPPTRYKVTVKFHCTHNAEHFEIAQVNSDEMDYSIEPATCEENGSVTYYAFIAYRDNEYDDEHVDVLPALRHDYNDTPTFTWAEDGSGYTATAGFVCKNDGAHIVPIEDVAVSSEYTEPTCTEDGFVTYTATATANGAEYTDTKVVVDEGTLLGHSDVTHHEGVNATFDHDGNKEYWVCGVCGKKYADEGLTEELDDVYLPQLTEIDGMTFTAWTATDSLPAESGNYYLTENVEPTSTWQIGAGKEINLCLNGHFVKMENGSRFLELGENAVFGLYECDNSITGYYWINQDSYSAEITGEEDYLSRTESDFVTGIIRGGYITGCSITESGAVIYAASGSVTNLYGGTIIGNSTYSGNGGVYCSDDGVNATLNLAGADLIGNSASAINGPQSGYEGSGGAVYSGSGIVTMTGGNILYNVAYGAGAIRVPDPDFDGTGVFTMSGGRIAFNSIDYMYNGNESDDGIIVIKNGTFIMTGGSIDSNNTAKTVVVNLLGGDDGVPYGGVFDMRGGSITENGARSSYYSTDGAVYVGNPSHSFIVSGDATVMGNADANVYLTSEAQITVGGEMTGMIGVTMNESGVFTTGYADRYPDAQEVTCFVSDSEGCKVSIVDGEVGLEKLLEVHFVTDGGSEIATQYVEYGGYAIQPEPPTKDGFTFAGWYGDSDHLTVFYFDRPITTDKWVYADWTN